MTEFKKGDKVRNVEIFTFDRFVKGGELAYLRDETDSVTTIAKVVNLELVTDPDESSLKTTPELTDEWVEEQLKRLNGETIHRPDPSKTTQGSPCWVRNDEGVWVEGFVVEFDVFEARAIIAYATGLPNLMMLGSLSFSPEKPSAESC